MMLQSRLMSSALVDDAVIVNRMMYLPLIDAWNAVDLSAAVNVFQQLFGQFIFTLSKKKVEKERLFFAVPSSER